MNVLSLFSGIGAHDLGLERAGFTIKGQVEIDEYCQYALKKHWPKVPKWTDIRRVTANDIRYRIRRIDLVTGGFPCQDVSNAGKKAGVTDGKRSGLWREMWRLIRELHPSWLLIENVPGIRTKGIDRVLSALEILGYTCEPIVLGAFQAGAPLLRERLLIVGSAKGERISRIVLPTIGGQSLPNVVGTSEINGEPLSSTNQKGHQRGHQRGRCTRETRWVEPPCNAQAAWEEPITLKPEMGIAIDGDARRLARWRRAAVEAIGNIGLPPAVFELVGRAIMTIEGIH